MALTKISKVRKIFGSVLDQAAKRNMPSVGLNSETALNANVEHRTSNVQRPTLITDHRSLITKKADESQWVYQSSRCFQLSPDEAGFMTQIRPGGAATVDQSFGNDLFVVSDLNDFESAIRHEIDRPEIVRRSQDGREFLGSVHWCGGGFVPLGAMRDDGTPHPHAGTGFGVSEVVGYPVDYETKKAAEVLDHWDEYEAKRGIENPLCDKALAVDPNPARIIRLYQFRYDGKRFWIEKTAPFELDGFEPARKVFRGLRSAIPDDDDLLYPFTVRRMNDGTQICVVGRWSRNGGEWAVADFVVVAGAENSSEPSLERGRDGALFFSCRAEHGLPHLQNIRVWRSDDGGSTWRMVIDIPNVRPASPVTINRTVGGDLFILGNVLDPEKRNREILAAWPLSPTGDRLLEPVTLLNSTEEFGYFRSRFDWYADHPIGSVVHLGDGAWHCVVTCRLACRVEVGSDLPPTPLTGTYLAEVFSDGNTLPVWRF